MKVLSGQKDFGGDVASSSSSSGGCIERSVEPRGMEKMVARLVCIHAWEAHVRLLSSLDLTPKP